MYNFIKRLLDLVIATLALLLFSPFLIVILSAFIFVSICSPQDRNGTKEKIIVDKNSLRYLVGTELDFVRDGLNSSFKFNNPNAAESCGCGESFSLKKELEK